jgi:hypothetical protein
VRSRAFRRRNRCLRGAATPCHGRRHPCLCRPQTLTDVQSSATAASRPPPSAPLRLLSSNRCRRLFLKAPPPPIRCCAQQQLVTAFPPAARAWLWSVASSMKERSSALHLACASALGFIPCVTETVESIWDPIDFSRKSSHYASTGRSHWEQPPPFFVPLFVDDSQAFSVMMQNGERQHQESKIKKVSNIFIAISLSICTGEELEIQQLSSVGTTEKKSLLCSSFFCPRWCSHSNEFAVLVGRRSSVPSSARAWWRLLWRGRFFDDAVE